MHTAESATKKPRKPRAQKPEQIVVAETADAAKPRRRGMRLPVTDDAPAPASTPVHAHSQSHAFAHAPALTAPTNSSPDIEILMPAERRSLNISELLRQYHTSAQQLAADDPELIHDRETFMDTLEGMTDLPDALVWLATKHAELEAEIPGIEQLAKMYAARAKVRKNRADRLWKLMEFLLKASHHDWIERPHITIALRRGREVVRGEVVDLTPADYYEVERKPDKRLIEKALKEGYEVPGFILDRNPDYLDVRIANVSKD